MSGGSIKEGKTKVIRVDPDDYHSSELEEPARALRRGALVGFPTETVYGIAANERDKKAVKRLLEIRNSPSDKKLSIHIADIDDFLSYCSNPPPMAIRLASRFWPGPLTIVLPHEERGTIGVRMPSNDIALDLIKQSGVPVVAPSANLSGDDPATCGEDVLDVFEGKIEYLVDGGPTNFGKSSTVVKIDGDDWEMLREGAIPEELIVEESGKQILFVCTGNTCRSPMAEALAWNILEEKKQMTKDELKDNGFRIESAGTSASSGGSAASMARRVMKEDYGISIRDHYTRSVTPSLITESDLIIVMTPGHKQSILNWIPEVEERIIVLNESDGGIPDPVGGTLETYRKTANILESSIGEIITELL